MICSTTLTEQAWEINKNIEYLTTQILCLQKKEFEKIDCSSLIGLLKGQLSMYKELGEREWLVDL